MSELKLENRDIFKFDLDNMHGLPKSQCEKYEVN